MIASKRNLFLGQVVSHLKRMPFSKFKVDKNDHL